MGASLSAIASTTPGSGAGEVSDHQLDEPGERPAFGEHVLELCLGATELPLELVERAHTQPRATDREVPGRRLVLHGMRRRRILKFSRTDKDIGKGMMHHFYRKRLAFARRN